MPESTYTARPKLEINGEPAPQKLLDDILQIAIEESLHLSGMFTIVVRNSALPGQTDTKFWEHEPRFAIGKSIRIGFTNSATESKEYNAQKTDWLLSGEVTAIETHFTSGSQAPIIIRGYDASHRLYRGHHNRSFQNMTDTDIVTKIIGEAGIQTGTLDSSGTPHAYVFQENQTNIEFLRERASRIGFELFVQDGKLHFRKPKKDRSLELKWMQGLDSFQVRISSAEQVGEVEVRGWDYKQRRAIVANRKSAKILTETGYGDGKDTSSAFQQKPAAPKLIVVDQPIASDEEAEDMAQALFNELSDEFVHADAVAQGHPDIRPGRVVDIKGDLMGKYEGQYYITETHHTYIERVYRTAFSVRGLRGGNLLSLIAPSKQLQPGQTFLIGIVTDNEDKENLGRVRVKFPTLTEEHVSDWARVVAIGAGGDRGFDCLPEKDDEVLVGFEHGDIHRPFVIGGLWNGLNQPPEKVEDSVVENGGVRLRTFKTRTKHILQFIEEDKGNSQAGIHLTSADGHEVYLNDSDRYIEVRTKGGHYLRLDDKQQYIELTSNNGHQLKLDDRINKVSLSSKGSLSVTAATNLDLTATAGVDLGGRRIIKKG